MRAVLICCLALLPSCSLFEKEKEEPKKETRTRLVGRIASIPSGSNFVLIESYGPWRVGDGGLLSGVGGEGRTSNLKATGEKLDRYVAADIISGVAKIGDSVYYRSIADSKEETAPGSPTVPGATTPGLETQKAPVDIPAKP